MRGMLKMIFEKSVSVVVGGRNEVGQVIRENKKSVWIKLNNIPRTPTIKRKKAAVRLLLADVWER